MENLFYCVKFSTKSCTHILKQKNPRHNKKKDPFCIYFRHFAALNSSILKKCLNVASAAAFKRHLIVDELPTKERNKNEKWQKQTFKHFKKSKKNSCYPETNFTRKRPHSKNVTCSCSNKPLKKVDKKTSAQSQKNPLNFWCCGTLLQTAWLVRKLISQPWVPLFLGEFRSQLASRQQAAFY